ncbi:unnamed protein product [Rotaria sp. Silwood1]|nr:unnamed protein product [Rotaria sp. Silwood1]
MKIGLSRADSKLATTSNDNDTTVAAATAQISVWDAAASPPPETSVVPKSARGSPPGNERFCSAFPTVHQVILRRGLCSAVPDSTVLTPVRRSDQGGSKGQEISVYTNHFHVDIYDTITSQYDIDIVMIDRFDKLRVTQKKRPLGTLVRQDRIENIYDFIKKKINIRPREIVRIIETLFKQRSRNELISIRNQFYDRHRQLEDLSNGRGIVKGFHQALFPTQGSLTLNINLAFTYFYMPLNFVGFASKHLQKDITKDL